ncbi:hypothetical protein FQN57_004270 [Myotisia sp. PD_48]|nr:hypothetical protein FQN57_004270 [Myotisia sp. PD_48]
MAPPDDLKSHAASSQDFYGLLSISSAAADAEIRRAYRRTALKYHPDKITNPTPADIEKFHLLQIAYDVLSEPTIRQLYDNAREARERKRKENEMLQGARRRMKEDLEAREKGLKRPWGTAGPGVVEDEDLKDAEDKLAREIQRLAEDGRRRRQAKEELMRREVLEEEERQEQMKEEAAQKDREEQRSFATQKNMGGTSVPEINRTVKVRWVREALGLDIDKDRLESLLSAFGKVENTFMLKDKRQRVGEKREKKTIATGVVVFTSVVGAHAAVEARPKQKGNEWNIIQSVEWASSKEPDWDAHRSSSPAQGQQDGRAGPSQSQQIPKPNNIPAPTSSFSRPSAFPGLDRRPCTTDGSKNAPSFSSFSLARPPPGLDTTSPSLEEITLIRLRNAERKKLNDQIQREDETASRGDNTHI